MADWRDELMGSIKPAGGLGHVFLPVVGPMFALGGGGPKPPDDPAGVGGPKVVGGDEPAAAAGAAFNMILQQGGPPLLTNQPAFGSQSLMEAGTVFNPLMHSIGMPVQMSNTLAPLPQFPGDLADPFTVLSQLPAITPGHEPPSADDWESGPSEGDVFGHLMLELCVRLRTPGSRSIIMLRSNQLGSFQSSSVAYNPHPMYFATVEDALSTNVALARALQGKLDPLFGSTKDFLDALKALQKRGNIAVDALGHELSRIDSLIKGTTDAELSRALGEKRRLVKSFHDKASNILSFDKSFLDSVQLTLSATTITIDDLAQLGRESKKMLDHLKSGKKGVPPLDPPGTRPPETEHGPSAGATNPGPSDPPPKLGTRPKAPAEGATIGAHIDYNVDLMEYIQRVLLVKTALIAAWYNDLLSMLEAAADVVSGALEAEVKEIRGSGHLAMARKRRLIAEILETLKDLKDSLEDAKSKKEDDTNSLEDGSAELSGMIEEMKSKRQ